MAALDFPLLWIEVVGTVADVLLPAQRHQLIRNEHVAFRGIRRKIHSLFAQIADGILVGEFYLWEDLCVKLGGECQTLVGNDVFALACSQFDAGMYHLQVSGSFLIDGFPSAWDGIEVVVFGYCFIVGRLQPVCWNLRILSLVASVLSFILIFVFLLLFIFLLHFRLSLFSENSKEDAFSARLAWEETIDRDI